MSELEKTVVLVLDPAEYENRAKILADYILSQNRSGNWISTERKHLKRFQSDANYDRYYIKLKFEKATF